jgi:SAM-dependent methyltransferase
MNWTQLDWPALDRLRDGFLHGAAAAGPYWRTVSALASYDLTYGERIAWKWDAVLRELSLRGWTPPAGPILDWGCGSGTAARRVIGHFGAGQFTELLLWDHEPMAVEFAQQAARDVFPTLRPAAVTPGFLAGSDAPGLVVVSHVLNELSAAALAELRDLLGRAQAVLWVESGTRETSRRLSAEREILQATFEVVAPCTHDRPCPMLATENERHWCHFFAPVPGEIFANPDWVKFGQRAGIDLRSLPYCFLALDRRHGQSAAPDGLSRVIGRPEHFKPYARLLNCDAAGLAELTVPKRTAPALYKELDRTKVPLVYRWEREGAEVKGGQRLQPSAG